MNVLSILASPKKQGNTATLLKAYLEGVETLTPTPQVETIDLSSKEIQFCTGCKVCQKSSQKTCVIADDMQEIYKLIEKADVLVFTTPVYVFNMTGQLKTFLDRLYAMDYKAFTNKKIVLLTTYGAASEATAGVQNIIHTFEMFSKYLGMEFMQNLNISTSEKTIQDNELAKKAAYQLGTELIKLEL